MAKAGLADMQAPGAPEDCEHSCVDWYGNARLFFLRDGVFALSGDRMKEPRHRPGGLVEVRELRLP